MEKRAEYARKDDLTRGKTIQWTAIKEAQNAVSGMSTINDAASKVSRPAAGASIAKNDKRADRMKLVARSKNSTR